MKPESATGLSAKGRKRCGVPRILCILLWAFLGSMLGLPLQTAGGEDLLEPEGKEVLLLNSFHQGDPKGDRIIAGITKGLLSGMVFHVEHLDLVRRHPVNLEPHLVELLGVKYRGRLGVVMTCGGAALDFILKYRTKLFPGVPVVFCGVEEIPEGEKGSEKVTGIVETPDEAKNVALALSLHPDRKLVVVSADDTLRGRRAKSRAMEAVPAFDGIEAIDPADPAQRRRMEEQPEKSVLIWLHPFLSPRTGREKRVDAKSPAEVNASLPGYSVWDFAIGGNIVGGQVVDCFSEGERAATMALSIMQGRSPQVSKTGTVSMFDFNLLKKYHINLAGLPEKSVLKNRTTSTHAKFGKGFLPLLLFVGIVAGGGIWIRRVVKEAEERGRLIGGESEKEWEKKLYDGKMALLERVSGGISHDLRNPLGAIKNAVFFLNMATEDPEPEIRETIEILEMEIVNSERIINSLTEFSRTRPPVKKRVNINRLMTETLSAVRFPDRVVLENEMEPVPELMADPEQLEKVFRNIIINAVKSMPGGGRLVLRAEERGDVVAIAAEDNGSGITREEMERLFEPFFTTRAKGIGLGLTITKEMVEENGGTIEVASRPGEGSTFTVLLPLG